MSGIASGPSAISDTSGGFLAGGGVNYNINENVGLGLFANWNRQYQRVHGVGDVRFVTTGVQLLVQESLPAPPAPVAQVPPPPPAAPPMRKKIVLRGVNFDFDKSYIRPVDEPILEEACKILKAEPNIDVSCEGHTDLVGTEAYNMALSQRRANAVRNWFTSSKCGLPASRLTAKGFGESNPVENTTGPSLQNRRTELIVTN
jgi:outer membrane protein OmpA-like peptidoglycan-associated protein